PAPAAAKMKPESSVDVSEESEQQLQNLIRECSSSVIERMRCIYERKKRETEREAMRLFSQMPLDRQKEFIEMQEKQHQRKLRPRRRFADFVRARMPQGITDELLQQTHLSALGIGCDDSDDSFHYDSPIEERPQEENEEDSLRSLNDSPVTSSNHRRDIS
uniref:Uncharacterized protein n=1 Tax=Parascaris univalens TaxID=6257 RepID=A0A915BCG0_PARUN